MPSISGPAAIVGAGAAAAGAANNIFGGGGQSGGGVSGQPQGSQAFIPPGQPGVASLLLSDINAQAPSVAQGQSQVPYYQNIYANQADNPYYASQQAAINNATSLAPGALQAGYNAGTNLYGAGGQALGLINPLIQSSFDPEGALYNRTLNNLTNQVGSTNAQYGLAGSPAGAGVANQALSNFNIDWQNNLLGRQIQGVQGVGSLVDTGRAGYAGGQGLQTGGIGAYTTEAQVPYQFSTGQNNNVLQALQALTRGTSAVPGQGAYGNISSAVSPLQSYLGLGQGASSLASQTGQTGFNQNQVLGSNLSTALSNPALANLFGGGNNSIGSGGYGGQQFFGLPGVNTGATGTSYQGFGGYFGPQH